jgi:TonB family protein
MMKRVAVAAVFASLSMAMAAPALADDYDDAVVAQISKFVAYPQEAASQEVEGRVGVVLDVDAQGHVTTVTLDNHSGSAVLDRAALVAVRRAAPSLAVATNAAHKVHLFVNYKLI